MTSYRDLTRSELESLTEGLGLPIYRARQLFQAIWQRDFEDIFQITSLPKDLRAIFSARGTAHLPDVVRELKSSDGTVKLVLGLADGLHIETVLIPERDHVTVCVSTQVGCAMGCTFCHTAQMGFRRNLSPGEIASQPLVAMKHARLEEKPRNIVFMGMGEPLANLKNLIPAIKILTDRMGLDYSPRRITVSTCGLVPELLRMGAEIDVGLAVSLHAADNDTRGRLMPVNRRYPLPELIRVLKAYPLPPRRRITFEYLLLAGVNDRPEDARRLARLLRGIPSKINLIPFNPSEGIPYKEPQAERILAFQKVLAEAHYTAIIRKSKGRDIAAACGQLFQGRQTVA
ncbi:MAG: 23S rRNA (adenine(2503)-C(2))-methyltransferase RlmN [Deltaproteobacteria bacterium]